MVRDCLADIVNVCARDAAFFSFASWSGDGASDIPEVPPIRIGGLTIVDVDDPCFDEPVGRRAEAARR